MVFLASYERFSIDLGNILPSNVLLSKDAFSSLIKPDSGLSRAVKSDPELSICTWALGCTSGTTWAERLLTFDQSANVGVPTVLPSDSGPTVMRVDYLCPEFRTKSSGSLITSVFIGKSRCEFKPRVLILEVCRYMEHVHGAIWSVQVRRAYDRGEIRAS